MCGILFLAKKQKVSNEDLNNFCNGLKLKGMRLRGPDNFDYNLLNNNVIFGHTRLSIIDLSKSGNQPMKSANNRFVITFNGEIFNYKELKNKLRFESWRSNTDTEVILEIINKYGVKKGLNMLNGDFAMVIYDNFRNEFIIARDRFGAKPVYYYEDQNLICVSSRVESLLLTIGKKAEPDLNSISEYFHNGIGGESLNSWFKGIKRFPPGSFSINKLEEDFKISFKRYWDYPESIKQKNNLNFINKYIDNCVGIRLDADVPVSIALSGGLDSSSIAISAQKKGTRFKAITFDGSSGGQSRMEKSYFKNKEDNLIDFQNSKLLSENLKIPQEIVKDSKSNLVRNLSECIYALESGHTSTSIITAAKVYKKASKYAKVIVEGQGADELMGGYYINSAFYFFLDYVFKFKIKEAIHLFKFFRKHYSLKLSLMTVVRELRLPCLSFLFCKLSGRDKLLQYKKIRKSSFHYYKKPKLFKSCINWHLARLQQKGLINLLQYGDALSMNHSIESRNPYLDIKLIEYIFKNKSNQLYKYGLPKFPIRKYCKNYFNNAIINSPVKEGFKTNISKELTSQLGEISLLLKEKRTLERNIWKKKGLKIFLESYNNESNENHFKPNYNTLYRILSIELWFRIFID